MAEEKAEVQKQYAMVQDAKKSQEQYVRDMNALTKGASYDHVVDLCYRHMKKRWHDGEKWHTRSETLTFIEGFYGFASFLKTETRGKLLGVILSEIQAGHYAKWDDHDGVSFALSSLPNHMAIKWDEIREAILKGRARGPG